MPPTRARRLVQSVGPSSGGTVMAAASIGVVSISSLEVLVAGAYSIRLGAGRKTKLLPSGIQVGCPANPAPPRPPPRPPALRVSSVIGCFWAKAEAARRRRMLNFVMVGIVARGGRGTARACAAGGPRAGAGGRNHRRGCEIGRAHVRTPVTDQLRMRAPGCKKK